MAQTINTLAGIFDDSATAQRAVQELIDNGFRREDVQVTANDSIASEAARGNAGFSGQDPRDTTTGGGIAGFFRNLFGNDDESGYHQHYAEAVRRGSSVVTVRANDQQQQDRAIDILNRYGAVDVQQKANDWKAQGYQGVDNDSVRDREQLRNPANTTTGDQTLPVVQEELQVGKRAIQRGGVRVHTRVVDEPVEQQVNLREEHVRVDRRPVNRAATEADFHPGDQVIEVNEMTEQPIVSKTSRVVEEVVVGKDVTERSETVRDSVRHTDVQVENLTGTNRAAMTDYDTDFRNDYKTRLGKVANAGAYETFAPAYQYGSRMAADPRYQGRGWNDVESTLKTDYLRDNPNSTWDNMKGAVRYGWEKVTGKR